MLIRKINVLEDIMIKRFNLEADDWHFKLSQEMPDINAGFEDSIPLPSTVSQQKKPPVDDARNDGFLTDPFRFEGYALYERTVSLPPECEGDIFLVMERTRVSRLWINGRYAGSCNSLCTPHRYDITEFFTHENMRITIMIDNVSYPVAGGHMTSQDTQTNWLGITGGICIECLSRPRLENIRLYPDVDSECVKVSANVCGGSADIVVSVDGFPQKKLTLCGSGSFIYKMKGAQLWSEHHPFLYEMTISVGGTSQKIRFGMRRFSVRDGGFFLNGEKIFLRGKHDGMIFPLTGAAPTDTASWKRVFETAMEYGINHYRFHTCCPPEAAFCAADELGVYLEPELPFWGTVDEEITTGQQYLIDEGFRILDSFANHPSFFALSLGNELWGSQKRLNEILGSYKKYDSRPLYTQGSNNFQFSPCTVENDDFFVGVRFSRNRLIRGSYAMCDAPLGHIQTNAPDSIYTYSGSFCPKAADDKGAENKTIQIQYQTGVKTVSAKGADEQFVPQIPVVSHETGQYFIYPDYCEIEKYTGVLKPYNLEIFRQRLENAGLLELADKYFRASGRFAAECYKNEIEAALRTEQLSGFQLLDLQDFTGQGGALVGILNAFMENKGIISADEWRGFCSDRVLLGCMESFVHAAGERLSVNVKLYNYAGNADIDPEIRLCLMFTDESRKDCLAENNANAICATVAASGNFKGGVFDIGTAELELPKADIPTKAFLTLTYGNLRNKYALWIYPSHIRESSHDGLTVTDCWSTAKSALAGNGRVLFMPQKLDESNSIEGTYCTDFWNYPMFSAISESMNKPLPVGTLGLLIDNAHPALSQFASETYSTAQWYDIVNCSRALIIDGTSIQAIVRTIDNCGRNHSLADIFEVNTGGGRLLVCTAALGKSKSPVCRCLLKSLTDYAASDKFLPAQDVNIEIMDKLFLSEAI